MTNWHSFSIDKTIKALKADDKNGLTEKEAEQRLKKFGANRLPKKKPLSKTKIFWEQLKSPFIYILLFAGVVTLFLGKRTDSIVIFGAVALNTFVGYFQENKASRALEKLKKALVVKAVVVRDGREKQIEQEGLVPGDIFVLRVGDKVPSDGRLILAKELEVNEAVLTGEWLPSRKDINILIDGANLGDRQNMVYQGSLVENGWGRVVATETGGRTEIGQVARILRETKEERTPLQKRIGRFSKIVGFIILIVSAFIFIGGVINGRDVLEMFETAVAVAVAAIPEGLPVSLTVILALGMQRILKKKGLVRRLSSAETLGSTSVICTDKTGTLTEAKMEVSAVLTGQEELFSGQDQPPLEKIDKGSQSSYLLALKIAMLANEAFIENPDESLERWRIRGRPTQRALFGAALQAGLSRESIERKQPRVDELIFDPVCRYSASLHRYSKSRNILYMMGAPELILKESKSLELEGRQISLSSEKKSKIVERYEKLASQGQRVLAVSYRFFPEKKTPSKLEKICHELVFVGLIALHDPIRKDAKEAIKLGQQAGMRPIIVTGDHRLTAVAVAKELGFKIGQESVMEGSELAKISDQELKKRLKKIKVFARVEPAQKLKIIQAWQEEGEVVAMTGDGVNDAPALKKADIGVALGSGTEIAKEVSDLVLLTDKFSIIVDAVEQGRAIVSNIRKVITYLLSDSFTEVVLIGASIVFGLPLPVLPVQILWVNLIEDGLPDIALALEPKEQGLMKEPPQPRKKPLLTGEMKSLIFIIGILTDIFLLGLFIVFLKYSHYSIEHIRTLIFAGLSIDSLFYVFSCKSLKKNLWHTNILNNKYLLAAWFFGFCMLFMGSYFPPFQALLGTVALSGVDWLILIGLGLFNLILIEMTKWWYIRRSAKKTRACDWQSA